MTYYLFYILSSELLYILSSYIKSSICVIYVLGASLQELQVTWEKSFDLLYIILKTKPMI